MPSSGARSGTKSSRNDRGAGTGQVGPVRLACGHETHLPAILANPRRWWFDDCRRFVDRAP